LYLGALCLFVLCLSAVFLMNKDSHNALKCQCRRQLICSSVPEIVTHTNNHFTALWILSGTTQVSRYQKKHSPTHTYRGHQSSLVCFIHLQYSSDEMVMFKNQWNQLWWEGSLWLERFVEKLHFEPGTKEWWSYGWRGENQQRKQKWQKPGKESPSCLSDNPAVSRTTVRKNKQQKDELHKVSMKLLSLCNVNDVDSNCAVV